MSSLRLHLVWFWLICSCNLAPRGGALSQNIGMDAGTSADAGMDAGSPPDADTDGGPPDAGSPPDADTDGGPPDAGSPPDAGMDGGPDDAGSPPDTGMDGGPTDAGSPPDADTDAGPDAGPCGDNEHQCAAGNCCPNTHTCGTAWSPLSGDTPTCVGPCPEGQTGCGTSCCTADQTCGWSETQQVCYDNCAAGTTTCPRGNGAFDCCGPDQVCGPNGCWAACGPGGERCGRDCCDPTTQYCEGSTCRERQCTAPNFSCGTACCSPDQRCNDYTGECTDRCENGEVACGDTCCPAAQGCMQNGSFGTCGREDCPAGKIECHRFGEDTPACCDEATERCFGGRCVPNCPPGQSVCGDSCCEFDCGSHADSGAQICCAEGQTGCGGQCCGDGQRCYDRYDWVTDSYNPQCVAECGAGQTSCGTGCCGPNQQCIVDNRAPRCVPACPADTESCGVFGDCCFPGTHCATLDNGSQVCALDCRQGEIQCGATCCNGSQVCDQRQGVCVQTQLL